MFFKSVEHMCLQIDKKTLRQYARRYIVNGWVLYTYSLNHIYNILWCFVRRQPLPDFEYSSNMDVSIIAVVVDHQLIETQLDLIPTM